MKQVGVPESFQGKNIFITGGTGFIGKVLVEKLLRSCPGIGKIYLLIRGKGRQSVEERLEDISQSPLFERLHREQPQAFRNKVIGVPGDVSLLGLDLRATDWNILTEEVHVVFHVAATVKFDQPLGEAIIMNVRGTREVCQLALEMKCAELVVHVSTAYAHANHNPIEEHMYPATTSWQQCIEAAEHLNAEVLSILQPHFMASFPNTYTFTKGLGERVVHDMLHQRIANMIIRPSIIVSTWRDPIPGWVDNFNGPVGMIVANGTGLVRINFTSDHKADYVPVDILIRAIINCAWHRMALQSNEKSTSVHNASANQFAHWTFRSMAETLYAERACAPSATCVWALSPRQTTNMTVFNFFFILLHLVPSLFFDCILRLFKYRPIVLRIQRRIFTAVNALRYFLVHSWDICNDSVCNIELQLCEKDHADFGYHADEMDENQQRDYIITAMIGGIKYLLKQDLTKTKQYRRKLVILEYIRTVCKIALYAFLGHLVFLRWNVPGMLYMGLIDYFANLPEHAVLSRT